MGIPNVQIKEEDLPKITLEDGKFLHNGRACKVILHPDRIRVGCTVITAEALQRLWYLHLERFKAHVVQHEEGSQPHPC